MYVSSNGDDIIYKITINNLTNPPSAGTPIPWATGINGPFGLAISGNYLYVSTNDSTVIQINLSDGSIANPLFLSGLNSPIDLLVNGNYLYVLNVNDGSIGQYELPTPPVPPVPPVPLASPAPTCYPYKPYLQPTPSLGSGARYAQAASIGPKPQIASANRIYSYYKRQNQGDAFYNQLFFSIYGVKR